MFFFSLVYVGRCRRCTVKLLVHNQCLYIRQAEVPVVVQFLIHRQLVCKHPFNSSSNNNSRHTNRLDVEKLPMNSSKRQDRTEAVAVVAAEVVVAVAATAATAIPTPMPMNSMKSLTMSHNHIKLPLMVIP